MTCLSIILWAVLVSIGLMTGLLIFAIVMNAVGGLLLPEFARDRFRFFDLK
jgi:hypothetical protein